MLSREEGLGLVTKNVTKRNIVHHMFAVEAIMRGLAQRLKEDSEAWGMVGLLHDIDYEKTEATPEKHGLLAESLLKETVPPDVIKAIKAHNSEHTGTPAETRMEKALIACDAISGLLVACALVMPSKRLAEVKVETVAKKFRDRDFARGVDRNRILVCEQVGVPKEEFYEIALNALKSVAPQIGL